MSARSLRSPFIFLASVHGSYQRTIKVTNLKGDKIEIYIRLRFKTAGTLYRLNMYLRLIILSSIKLPPITTQKLLSFNTHSKVHYLIIARFFINLFLARKQLVRNIAYHVSIANPQKEKNVFKFLCQFSSFTEELTFRIKSLNRKLSNFSRNFRDS